MNARTLALAALASALAACGGTVQFPLDAATAGEDAAALAPDASQPADAAEPLPGPDASEPSDAGQPDAALLPDAAEPGLDASSEPDVGPEAPDAAAPGPDAGPSCLGVDLEGACSTVGVCAGSTATCEATGWDCHYPATWEATEAACDGLDNDCNGATDEAAGCAECLAAANVLETDTRGFGLSLQWATHLGDTTYAVANPAADSSTAHLYVIDSAALTSDVSLDPGTAEAGNAVLGAGGVLHLGVIYDPGTGKRVYYQQRDGSGAKVGSDVEVAALDSSMTANFETRLAARGTSVAMAWMSADDTASWADQTTGTWLPGGTLPAPLSDLAFEITSGDEVAWAWIDTAVSGDKPIYFASTAATEEQLGTSWYVQGIALGPPDLKADAAGDLHLAWQDGAKVRYRTRSGGTWGAQETAISCSPGSAHDVSLTFGPSGPGVTATCVSYTAGTYLAVAGRSAAGTWTAYKAMSTSTSYYLPHFFFDSAGREQLVLLSASNGLEVQAATRCYSF